MCVVSMVTDQFQFPKVPADWYTLPKPTKITYTPESIEVTKEMVPLLKEVIAKLDAIDKKLGTKDCDPSKKEKFLKALDELLGQ